MTAIDLELLHRQQNRCKQAVRKAILAGALKRPTVCEVCGKKGKLDSHHFDYMKPMEMSFVCRSCHVRLHKGIRRLIDQMKNGKYEH